MLVLLKLISHGLAIVIIILALVEGSREARAYLHIVLYICLGLPSQQLKLMRILFRVLIFHFPLFVFLNQNPHGKIECQCSTRM